MGGRVPRDDREVGPAPLAVHLVERLHVGGQSVRAAGPDVTADVAEAAVKRGVAAGGGGALNLGREGGAPLGRGAEAADTDRGGGHVVVRRGRRRRQDHVGVE